MLFPLNIKFLPALCLALLLAGCTSSYVTELSQNGNWRELGMMDASNGLPARPIQELEPADLEAARQEYAQGYELRRQEYCKVDGAWRLGFNGHVYYGICDDLPQAKQFRLEYNRGYHIYQQNLWDDDSDWERDY